MKTNDKKHLTSENGRPIADNQNTQTAGHRGPVTLQDTWLLEKMAHFDREVIPERRMHAKGAGAYGTFTVTHDITKYTRASIFSEIGKQTPCFVRFSTVAGERGAADAERDIRGFAMKFYTDSGNWDLVGNNTPVFFLRDPLKFPDLNHAIKRDPRSGMRSANSNWDFWTLLPEALHQVTITMSPRGIPASFRHMHGFGSHTYSFYDAENRRTWVKFHLRTLQGIRNMTDAEAEAVIAKDRESHQRDLFEAIERGDYPRWLMQVQLMTEEQARDYEINPFDLTKVWYHGDFPLQDVGILELNRNPENFFAEVEQAAFNPANIIEGIGFSPDKMLQGRLFSYEPNSYGEWKEKPSAKEPPLAAMGDVFSYDEREYDSDYYTQPGKLWRLMSAEDRKATCENTARAMAESAVFIKQRHIRNCFSADPTYGEGVAAALGLSLEEALIAEDPAHHEWDDR